MGVASLSFLEETISQQSPGPLVLTISLATLGYSPSLGYRCPFVDILFAFGLTMVSSLNFDQLWISVTVFVII